jgi:hypothetical protein
MQLAREAGRWRWKAACGEQTSPEVRMLTRARAHPGWSCTASCNLQAITATELPSDRVTGSGVGGSEREAWQERQARGNPGGASRQLCTPLSLPLYENVRMRESGTDPVS